ncbi:MULTISPECIES: type I restriction endonuclease subunit R [Rhodococcus]|nr:MULTISPECIES: DEAD/DEAH box helicase family protein [Rhodococcus]ARE38050.1 restriction endonuclease subunit R [Rhodococcus sp. BH4]MBQ9056073.1 type I restriction endonuclease subunit R [Rhodococcus sp. (in: high G+C Gram-positive bacteria)]OMQ29484.1 restriction endonuclease subunit R [Rhodococcus sp. D-1]QXC46393.1 DEAD/DEAH box helicase family protein [Rhodococcus qingshengii]
MADHNEIVFESEICAYLESHGWLYSANDTGYDRERALFPDDLFAWLQETQQAAYEKSLKAAGSEAKFLDVLTAALDKPLEHGGGTLNILRNGVQYIGGGRLKMAQFRPETSLNATTNAQYAAMGVRVMRQVHFSTADQRSIDLVFFVNGLPVATVELKTDFTQSLDEAINQYRKDRHPLTNGRPEPLLSFGHRALVHFAVSNDLAAMTTRLEGEKTHFLPFNMGHKGGSGNPPAEGGRSATVYMWERVWEKDAWLTIMGRLMIVETKEEWDVATGTSVRRTSMLFPRLHQWEAVTNIVAAVREEGVGQRYLIEHSAGSGKTNTIAWTAHRLARLHVNNEKVFDSVIVVVDRTVLDGQLQDAIRQIDGSGKIVATISPEDVRKAGAKSKSGLLATALKNGELIIAVTVQTFPFALEEISKDSSLKGRRFAVIADEAHSSQSGKISSKLKAVLTAEEVKEIEEGGEVDVEAILASEMTERAESENISYLAFTATPKNKTLELFGRKGPDGKPVEFHLYSMRQAIEEGYILDVLKGYQTYDTALKIAGKAESGDGGEVEEAAARKGLMRWVKLHPTNISQKVQIIVEHFHTNVAHLLEGKAKAMIVTDGRKAAVKYKKAIDAYIAKRAAEDASYNYRTLVAFSGSVTMDEDEQWSSGWGPQPSKDDEFIEANLNPGAGSDLAAAFKGATYKIMLVANKFQTGFDQPLLSAMYVDKKLSGVTTVQTLSRLNRTHRTASGEQKRKTFVIDFVNKPDAIRSDFEPYFTGATLETETDPYVVAHLATKLAQSGIYTPEQVRDVAELWVTSKGNNALSAAISPAKHDFARRYAAAIEADDKVTLNTLDLFRKDVATYVRLYDFMSQIVDYGDPYMEMLSIFLRLLDKVIADSSWAAEIDLSDVVLVGVKHNKAAAVDISLTGDGQLKGISAAGTGTRKEPKYVALQVVIDKMNDLFGAEAFTESQVREFVQGLVQRLLVYPDLVNQTKVNSKKQFMESQDFQSAVVEAVVDNQGAHNTMADYFFSDGPAIGAVIIALADAFYEAAIDQKTAV